MSRKYWKESREESKLLYIEFIANLELRITFFVKNRLTIMVRVPIFLMKGISYL